VSVSFLERYQHKVKTPEQIAALIGPFPRAQKVIMCHGVFDVVHPGHVRHLAYAKGKADLLIASITSDRHIKKGTYRPHVPENIRALNLAAFEMVDYVIIDEQPKPIANLMALKPDYFAKGFEYVADGLPAATQEELDLVESYGGELIFTPGDFVLSSSRLIDLALPNLRIEKLLSLMQTEGIDFDDLRNALSELKKFKVHVVGDTIVDSITRSTLIGGQTKTPTFSVLYEGRDDYVGGAGIVAQHIAAAGAQVVFSTVLGQDELGRLVQDRLRESENIELNAITDGTRPTTHKNAVVAGGYRLLKIDTVDNRSISLAIQEKLAQLVRTVETDAVVFSDFRHGIFNRSTIPVLTDAVPTGMMKVADSQVASRWGNITEFKGFDIVTPNEREARFALGDQDSGVGSLAGQLMEATGCKLLMLKLGERGLFTLRAEGGRRPGNYFSIDSFCDTVVDAVGAGDALLAYATLTFLATRSEAIAAILGAMAAAHECEVDGNIPVQPADVFRKIDQVERMSRMLESPASQVL
jgi:rfaE bifunctional protein kinase chain/domain